MSETVGEIVYYYHYVVHSGRVILTLTYDIYFGDTQKIISRTVEFINEEQLFNFLNLMKTNLLDSSEDNSKIKILGLNNKYTKISTLLTPQSKHIRVFNLNAYNLNYHERCEIKKCKTPVDFDMVITKLIELIQTLISNTKQEKNSKYYSMSFVAVESFTDIEIFKKRKSKFRV